MEQFGDNSSKGGDKKDIKAINRILVLDGDCR